MKRANGLLERIAEPENLRLAYWKAARHKRQRTDSRAFGAQLDRNLLELRAELLSGQASVGQHHFFTIHDPKERRICAACFRERVLHHAIVNVCEPVLERYQIFDSYACRRGKGRTAAIARAAAWARRKTWFLKLDVHRYYDSVDQGVLNALLARQFKDRALLQLLARIVAAYETEPGRGIPIGHLTSQHFGNLYLGAFDHWVKETMRIECYARYMDDMAFWSDDRNALVALRAAASPSAWREQAKGKDHADGEDVHGRISALVHPVVRCRVGRAFLPDPVRQECLTYFDRERRLHHIGDAPVPISPLLSARPSGSLSTSVVSRKKLDI